MLACIADFGVVSNVTNSFGQNLALAYNLYSSGVERNINNDSNIERKFVVDVG